MKKKHIFMAIIFFVVGLVYGAIFNSILRGENASALLSYVQGLFVGTLSAIIYSMIVFAFGYCFDTEYLDNAIIKVTTITMNVVAFVGLIFATTTSIANKEPIPPSYGWMHIVNLLFAIFVVGKGNYDSYVLKKNRKN